MKQARGCREPLTTALFSWDGEDLYRCPVRIVTEESWQAMRLFRRYQDGFLPVTGGIMDQAPAFIRAVEVLIKEEAEIQERNDG